MMPLKRKRFCKVMSALLIVVLCSAELSYGAGSKSQLIITQNLASKYTSDLGKAFASRATKPNMVSSDSKGSEGEIDMEQWREKIELELYLVYMPGLIGWIFRMFIVSRVTLNERKTAIIIRFKNELELGLWGDTVKRDISDLGLEGEYREGRKKLTFVPTRQTRNREVTLRFIKNESPAYFLQSA